MPVNLNHLPVSYRQAARNVDSMLRKFFAQASGERAPSVVSYNATNSDSILWDVNVDPDGKGESSWGLYLVRALQDKTKVKPDLVAKGDYDFDLGEVSINVILRPFTHSIRVVFSPI